MSVQASAATLDVPGVIGFESGISLLDGGELPICILQVGKVTDTAILRDASRPEVVAALRDLLHGREGAGTGPALEDVVTGGPATIVLAPEYALGSPDWGAVDDLVRATDRPLVLIVGFGMTPGAWLREWLTSAGATSRHAGWDRAHEVRATNRVYNGVWCWVHEPGIGTGCVAALKNFPEQRIEAAHASLDRGRSIVRISFADADVFPTICADLLQEPTGGSLTPRERIAAALHLRRAERPALVTGSLLQDRPSDRNWQRAIEAIVGDASPTRTVLLAIANQAYGEPCPNEEHDRWRSLSGVYAGFQAFPKGATPFPGGRSVVVGPAAVGLVVRECGPCVVGGPVLVGRVAPVTGLHLWRATTCLPLVSEGVAPPFVPHADVATYEAHRLTRRFPGQDGWCPRVARGLALLRTHLEGRALPDAADILRSLLWGTEAEAEDIADSLHLSMPELEAAMHALAFLATFDGLLLHDRPGAYGQLRFRDQDAHVLVWHDRKRPGRAMLRVLQEWMALTGAHPPLVVVGSGFRSPLPAGPVERDRRSDWSTPPPAAEHGAAAERSGGRDISLPRGSRAVSCVDLQDLQDLYLYPDDAADAERVAGFLARLLRDVPEREA